MEITSSVRDGVVVFSIVGDVSIFYKDAIDAALTEKSKRAVICLCSILPVELYRFRGNLLSDTGGQYRV